jgi:hypothetical protein
LAKGAAWPGSLRPPIAFRGKERYSGRVSFAVPTKERAMQELWDILIKVILPLAGILAVSILVRRLLPNPFSGGYGG